MDDAPLLVNTGLEVKEDSEPDKVVPVTIVTGYLGAGKSTLLKYITEHNAGKKIAIILNEFGDSADIERSLTISQDETQVEEWLELDNGCLCCTAKDAGVTAIENLMKRKGKFDYILLETTGIADPAPIASMFWLDQALNPSLQLDGIITVVDSVNIVKSIETGATARVQIACADTVIISKTDLVSDQELERVKEAIADINGTATLVYSKHGRVDVEKILDLQAYTTLRQDAFITSTPVAKHDKDITTITIPLVLKSSEEFSRFERKLQEILWEHTFEGHEIEIHRTKARLCFENKIKIIQGVRETYDVIDADKSDSDDSKVVLIGRGLKEIEGSLQKYFEGVQI